LVTGASAGIGAATARLLAGRGHRVVLVARRLDRLEKLRAELPGEGHECVALDLRETKAVAELPRRLAGVWDQIEILINSAGLAKGVDSVAQAQTADWDEMLDTNVRALMHVTRALLPALKAKGTGHIVNLGSVAGRWVYPGGAVYCATKFAVRAFSEGLRQDLLGSGIRVTNIEPGMVETEFSLVRLQDPKAAEAVYARMHPLRAEDIAETILWSLERPAHVNIQEMVVYPTDQAHVGQVYRR